MNSTGTHLPRISHPISTHESETHQNVLVQGNKRMLNENLELVKLSACDVFAKFNRSLSDIDAAIMGKPVTVDSRVEKEKAEVRGGKVVYVKSPVEERKVELTLKEFIDNPHKGEQESRYNNSLRTVISILAMIEKSSQLPGHEILTGSDSRGALLDNVICTDGEGTIFLRSFQNKNTAERIEKKLSEERAAGNNAIESNLLGLMDAIQQFGHKYYLNAAPTVAPSRKPGFKQMRLVADWFRRALPAGDAGAVTSDVTTASQSTNNVDLATAPAPLAPETSRRAPVYDKPTFSDADVPFSRFVYSELADKVITQRNFSSDEAKVLKSRMRHIRDQPDMKHERIPLVAMTYFERIKEKNPELDSLSVLVGALMLADTYVNDAVFSVKAWTVPTGFSIDDVKQAKEDALEALGYRIEITPDEFAKLRDLMKSRQKAPSIVVSNDVHENISENVLEHVSENVSEDVFKDSAYLRELFKWVGDSGADSVARIPVSSDDTKGKEDLIQKTESRLKSAQVKLDPFAAVRRTYEEMTTHVEEKANRLAALDEKIKSRNSSRFSTINDLRHLMREHQFKQAGKLHKSDAAYEQERNDIRTWLRIYAAYHDTTQSPAWQEKSSTLEKEVDELTIELKALREQLGQ